MKQPRSVITLALIALAAIVAAIVINLTEPLPASTGKKHRTRTVEIERRTTYIVDGNASSYTVTTEVADAYPVGFPRAHQNEDDWPKAERIISEVNEGDSRNGTQKKQNRQ